MPCTLSAHIHAHVRSISIQAAHTTCFSWKDEDKKVCLRSNDVFLSSPGDVTLTVHLWLPVKPQSHNQALQAHVDWAGREFPIQLEETNNQKHAMSYFWCFHQMNPSRQWISMQHADVMFPFEPDMQTRQGNTSCASRELIGKTSCSPRCSPTKKVAKRWVFCIFGILRFDISKCQKHTRSVVLFIVFKRSQPCLK